MRTLSKQVLTEISNFTSFCYCYEVTLTDGSTFFLTSASTDTEVEANVYRANCGLSLCEANFNDSARDYAILEGVFDDNAINKQSDLTGALVKISILTSTHLFHLITYRCTSCTKYDLSFMLHIEPESTKYNQTLLKSYSKTCRASFGDVKCRFDKKSVAFQYNIVEITGTEILLSNIINKENGYFTGGDVILEDNQFKTKILFHHENNIKLARAVPENLRHHKNMTLISGCDKRFLTCCNKFNNEVNFRGEPFIPEANFLKVY